MPMLPWLNGFRVVTSIITSTIVSIEPLNFELRVRMFSVLILFQLKLVCSIRLYSYYRVIVSRIVNIHIYLKTIDIIENHRNYKPSFDWIFTEFKQILFKQRSVAN